ncbi:hypothetical protein NQ314_015694 [Rhamnusium bicolor]|uniref:Poly [ADP-ribose] polymerase n=1 Tax=Rhamnusium bicolor TaxID=1586634 RepID=A0AAV8WY51_9CUCU|nr:hypothetical protein NQ314_015694 [Rhamnusium bicolor]
MEEQKNVFEPSEITPCPAIMNIQRIRNFCPDEFNYGEQIVSYEELDIYDCNYDKIEELFEDSVRLEIDRIIKVYNPYLKKSFELKRHLHYGNIQPTRLFHGTKENYVQSICEFNFNWRYFGRERGHRYGKGVYFTSSPSFASFFCDKGTTKKVMILADVLVKNKCRGNENLVVPPLGYDTAIAETDDGSVYVKFEDNEFYPAYIIHCIRI